MTLSLKDRLEGASVGLAAADAMTWERSRLAPEEAQRREPLAQTHGAVTTWAMAIAAALRFRSPGQSLDSALRDQLETLAAPRRGAALRGAPQGVAADLRQVARALEDGEPPKLAGIDEADASVIAATLPLAFTLGDADADVAAAVVDVCAVTHRHVRVANAAGLFVGGMRARLAQPAASNGEILDAAAAFSKRVLKRHLEARAGVIVGSATMAEGAAAMMVATARSLELPTDLWAPAGLDGRDDPERCAVGALLGHQVQAGPLVAIATERAAQGGDSDVTLPLWMAAVGAVHGRAALPLGVTGNVKTADQVVGRLKCLVQREPPMRQDLVVEELQWSDATEVVAPAASSTDVLSTPTGVGQLLLGLATEG